MILKRKPDWQTRLHVYLRACADAPFVYGRMDCGLFAAGAILAMTGVDVAESVRFSYRTQRGAAVMLKRVAGEVSALAIARELGARYGIGQIFPAMAQRGDVVCVGEGRAAALGVVALHGTDILGPGEHGLVRFPFANATAAWRIG